MAHLKTIQKKELALINLIPNTLKMILKAPHLVLGFMPVIPQGVQAFSYPLHLFN
jgi:hypothetical protein